jgi:hypothetical protein
MVSPSKDNKPSYANSPRVQFGATRTLPVCQPSQTQCSLNHPGDLRERELARRNLCIAVLTAPATLPEKYDHP